MLVAWLPTRWSNWCVTEEKKKVTEPFLVDEKQYKDAYN